MTPVAPAIGAPAGSNFPASVTPNASTSVSPHQSKGVAIVGATTTHTGEPWAGSGPYDGGIGILGLALVMVGLVRRHRAPR